MIKPCLLLLLSGCSYVHYQKGDVDVIGIELGTDKALAGFKYESDTAQVTLDSLDSNQTNSLSAIVEGATKGAIKGIK